MQGCQSSARRGFESFFGPAPIGRTKVPHRSLRARHPDGAVRLNYFTFNFAGFASGQIPMSHRVIGHFMPIRNNSPDKLRPVYSRVTDQEECRRCPVLRQHVEDLRCPNGIGTVVKREIDAALLGAVCAVTGHFTYAVQMFHSSGPFRSMKVPDGHSSIDRPIGETKTRSSSKRVGGRSGCMSAKVERMRTSGTIFPSPTLQSLWM